MGKEELLAECCRIVNAPKITEWYKKNLEGKSQGDTITNLEDGVSKGELTVREALSIALIVGYQWTVNFEEGRCPKTGNYFPTKENHDKNCRWCKQ